MRGAKTLVDRPELWEVWMPSCPTTRSCRWWLGRKMKNPLILWLHNPDDPCTQNCPPQDCPPCGQSWGGQAWGYSSPILPSNIAVKYWSKILPQFSVSNFRPSVRSTTVLHPSLTCYYIFSWIVGSRFPITSTIENRSNFAIALLSLYSQLVNRQTALLSTENRARHHTFQKILLHKKYSFQKILLPKKYSYLKNTST